MATVLRWLGRSLCVCGRGWFLGLMLLVMFGLAHAAPSARYGGKAGSNWAWVDPAGGNPGGYANDFEATINVDGVYVGKSAYRRTRAINAAKLAGGILTSAIASPVVGVVASVLIDAGLTYIDGKLYKPGVPPTGAIPGDPAGTGYQYNGGSSTLRSTPLAACQELAAEWWAGSPSYHADWQYSATVDASYRCTMTLSAKANPSLTQAPYANVGVQKVAGAFPVVPPAPVPVTGPTDADALAALQSKISPPSGMNATVAHNLADYARSQGIDLGTFTDYNGDVIAGPFDFPLPPKTSSSIDPVTGYRYDTNVVDAIHVDPNPDATTKEAEPLKLTQTTTQSDKVTKPDGSSTTQTTTKTSGQSAGVTNPNNAPTQDTNTPFSGPATGTLYTAKTKTASDVLTKFENSVRAAPWYAASAGFFSVNISGGSCPHWSMAANKWMPALDAGQFVCSDTMLNLYRAGGVIVLIVAAWAAFRIAFL